jgi:hypothetical protein
MKEEQWELELLDRGFNEAGSGAGGGSGSGCGSGFPFCGSGNRKKIYLCDGSEPTAPVLLDGGGHVLADPNIYNAVFRTHYVYNTKPFGVLPIS